MEISQLRSGLNNPAKIISSPALVAPKQREGGRDGGTDFVLTPALTLTLSPGERGQRRRGVESLADRPANPAVGISKGAGNISPSPRGRGLGEGGREINFPPALQDGLCFGTRTRHVVPG